MNGLISCIVFQYKPLPCKSRPYLSQLEMGKWRILSNKVDAEMANTTYPFLRSSKIIIIKPSIMRS